MRILHLFLILLTFSLASFAQNEYSEKVSNKWPYLFNNFQHGILYFNSTNASKAMFNIDITNQNFVYFNEDELIMYTNEAYEIDSLIMDNNQFIKHNSSIYEVLESKDHLYLLKRIRIDMNALNSGSGGYGTGSSSDASTKLTSIDVTNYTRVPYSVIKLERNKGTAFELITSYYLFNKENNDLSIVSKKTFEKTFENADVKGIIKTNKYKLKNETDLCKLFVRCTQ